jgi:hypothetical protein
MQTIDRTQNGRPDRALLAGAAFLAALALAAPSEAFAGCGGGTGAATGAYAPPGAAVAHSGPTPSAGSTGANSCGVNATKTALTGGTVTPSMTGVFYAGAITGNGRKRNGSTTFSHAATKVAGGAGGSAHFLPAGKRP